MPDLTPSAKASWRRFWRNGFPTPRQVADSALGRIAAAEELAETPADLRNLVDPHDSHLAELLPIRSQCALIRRGESKEVNPLAVAAAD